MVAVQHAAAAASYSCFILRAYARPALAMHKSENETEARGQREMKEPVAAVFSTDSVEAFGFEQQQVVGVAKFGQPGGQRLIIGCRRPDRAVVFPEQPGNLLRFGVGTISAQQIVRWRHCTRTQARACMPQSRGCKQDWTRLMSWRAHCRRCMAGRRRRLADLGLQVGVHFEAEPVELRVVELPVLIDVERREDVRDEPVVCVPLQVVREVHAALPVGVEQSQRLLRLRLRPAHLSAHLAELRLRQAAVELVVVLLEIEDGSPQLLCVDRWHLWEVGTQLVASLSPSKTARCMVLGTHTRTHTYTHSTCTYNTAHAQR